MKIEQFLKKLKFLGVKEVKNNTKLVLYGVNQIHQIIDFLKKFLIMEATNQRRL